MKLLSTKLNAPILRQRISADIHSQGKPTAFEKMTVSLVKAGKESEELKGQSIPSLFELLVGNDSADVFLDATLNRLFSPALAALGVGSDVHFAAYRDLPVSEIDILPNGEELLRSGLFPTQSRKIHRTILCNPLTGTVEEQPQDGGPDSAPEDSDRALPESLATGAWPEEAVDAFVRNTLLRPGAVLSGVSREDEGTVVWTSLAANLELEHGTLRATSRSPGVANYLNGLAPDEFCRLMLSGLEFTKVRGKVRKLDDVADTDLFPAGASPHAPESWIWLHPDLETFPNAQKGTRLEVVWPADVQVDDVGKSFLAGLDGKPDRLVLASAPYSDATASGDLRTFSHVVSARAFFARMPIEIPVGLREHLTAEVAASIANALISALRDSGHPRAIAHADSLRRFCLPRQNKHAVQPHGGKQK